MSEILGKKPAMTGTKSVLSAGGMIACQYTCADCGIRKQEVYVHARCGEDVVEWFRNVMTPALVSDHSMRSPDCHPTEFEQVLVPIPPGTEKIGGPVVN